MEQNKKRLQIVTNDESMLREVIDLYNNAYRTDFVFAEYIRDDANLAVINYEKATDLDIFQLAYNFGRYCEAFDKETTMGLPPGHFESRGLKPKR